MQQSIMHIDANSAYLSWTAVDLLERGHPTDYRKVPAVVAGNPENRHGIILAKSLEAKQAGISTAMTLSEAQRLVPGLVVLEPNYDLYMRMSQALYDLLYDYSPLIERYSIDECYLDYTASRTLFGDPVAAAHTIRKRVERELGFTVNIGVSVNKLLAKMGSELEKPNRVHTLYPSEIATKMWPLPTRELFMCGRATAAKLARVGINTIGEAAAAGLNALQAVLKPAQGLLIWRYANGLDDSPVVAGGDTVQKGVGNSTTLPRDACTEREAHETLLAIAERVGMRLRRLNCSARLVGLTLRTSELNWYQHQSMLDVPISSTDEIYREAKRLFASMWQGEPLRQLGIRLSELCSDSFRQLDLFTSEEAERGRALDSVIDGIRALYGDEAIIRGTFANNELPPLLGGVNDGNYLMMGGNST